MPSSAYCARTRSISSGRHCWTTCSRWRSDGLEQAEPLGDDLAEHARALAAAGDQDLERRDIVERRERQFAELGDFVADRIADQHRLVAVARLQPVDLVISGADRLGFAGEQPVDPARAPHSVREAGSGCAARSPPAARERRDSRRSRPPRRGDARDKGSWPRPRPRTTAFSALSQPIGPPPSRPAGRMWTGTSSNRPGKRAPRSSVISSTPWPRPSAPRPAHGPGSYGRRSPRQRARNSCRSG